MQCKEIVKETEIPMGNSTALCLESLPSGALTAKPGRQSVLIPAFIAHLKVQESVQLLQQQHHARRAALIKQTKSPSPE